MSSFIKLNLRSLETSYIRFGISWEHISWVSYKFIVYLSVETWKIQVCSVVIFLKQLTGKSAFVYEIKFRKSNFGIFLKNILTIIYKINGL